jgi:hypothetical protein
MIITKTATGAIWLNIVRFVSFSEYDTVGEISQAYTNVDIGSSRKYSSALKILKPFRPSSK